MSAPAIAPERVLFTFPDRVFSYECRGCGACCKGLGIGLDAAGGELDRLTATYPALIPFIRRRGDAWTAFNPRDRCWFLDDGGLCRVEVDHGRAAKPASCRLFPFNRIFRLGSFAVIDFNSVICPLQAGGAHPVAHADVLADIATIADPAVVATPLPAADPEAEGRALVERERAIAAACFAAAAAAAPVARSPMVAAALSAILSRPTPVPDPTPPTLANAHWLTPSMRFNELYGPRQYAGRAAIAAALPAITEAWLGFAAIGEELAQRPLGMQELTTLWSEQAPLTWLAAHWSDRVAAELGPLLALPPAARIAAIKTINFRDMWSSRTG